MSRQLTTRKKKEGRIEIPSQFRLAARAVFHFRYRINCLRSRDLSGMRDSISRQ